MVVVVVDEVVVMEAAAVEGAGGKSLRLVNFLLTISRSSLMRCSRVRGGEVVVGVVVVVVVVGLGLGLGLGLVLAEKLRFFCDVGHDTREPGREGEGEG